MLITSLEAAELTITIARTAKKCIAIWYEKKITNCAVVKYFPVFALPNIAPKM